ncbi:hypothetical protein [Pelomonas sp. Root1237]|uniref:hypothetical protein n=1 Tax=Pelomonas sp. Root1237 TaxID=1736434 RepID=UPI0006F97097|nr:hypothetical protein [Pelomonas sp. Root1237]KQV88166.1 hypothetical protein ASC91_15185 [Pelomonas sp. Root1237]
MHFRTFLKTGVEVLHLGTQHSNGNAWPLEHWKANSGRWRLFTPGIDAYLNQRLVERSFGTSIENFILLLEIADFAAWGIGVAFAGPTGYSSYKPKTRELRSVGQIDWLDVQMLTPTQQLQAYRTATVSAIQRASEATRKPKDFEFAKFAQAVDEALRGAKVSQVSRSAFEANEVQPFAAADGFAAH